MLCPIIFPFQGKKKKATWQTQTRHNMTPPWSFHIIKTTEAKLFPTKTPPLSHVPPRLLTRYRFTGEIFNYKFPTPSLFFFKSSTRLRSIAPLLLFFFLHKSKSLIFLFPSFFLFSETKWRRQQRQQDRLCRCWKTSWTSWSPRSETWTSWSSGGRFFRPIIWSSFRMVTLRRPSKSLRDLTTSSIIVTILTGFWVPRLLAYPSRTLPAGALATWCPRRSMFTPLMTIAL